MNFNTQCSFCGLPLYRNKSEQQQSKSGKFFCSPLCKKFFKDIPHLFVLPKDNVLFSVINKIYNNNRAPEYLTSISIYNSMGYKNHYGDYFVAAIARENGNSRLIGKTPKDIEYIRNCFDEVKLSDVVALPEFSKNWNKIDFKYWSPNDITYEIDLSPNIVVGVEEDLPSFGGGIYGKKVWVPIQGKQYGVKFEVSDQKANENVGDPDKIYSSGAAEEFYEKALTLYPIIRQMLLTNKNMTTSEILFTAGRGKKQIGDKVYFEELYPRVCFLSRKS